MAAHKGEKHHKAILTAKDVREIRKEYATGTTSYWKLCLKYGLASPAHIRQIIYREIWKHV